MRTRSILAGLTLAAGLLSAGCGGTEVEQDAQAPLSEQQDAIYACDGRNRWLLHYYSDSTYEFIVGGWSCNCGPQSSTWGRTTRWYRYESPAQSCN